MATLYQLLSVTPRRMLLAIARARDIPCPWEAPKVAVVEQLAGALADAAALDRVVEALPAAGRAALQDVQAAGGRMPRRHLAERYGDIRPYRPWRSGAPRRPWQDPASPLESLCFLGLLFLDPATDNLLLPDDLVSHLPALLPTAPQPAPAHGAAEPALLAIHDLACLLALLQVRDVQPRHGRWLTPRILAEWGARCARPPRAPAARGELATGRRRFLHYLAEAAGLVGLAGPYLKPTPAAWLWLAASPARRFDRLWQALLAPHGALWAAYRLPGHAALPAPALSRLVAAVVEALRDLDAADPAAFAGLLLRRRPALHDLAPANLLEPQATLQAAIRDLLAGPFTWLGALEEQGTRLRLTAWGAAGLGLAPPPDLPPPPHFTLACEPQAGDALSGALVFSLPAGRPDPADLMLLAEVSVSGPASPGASRLTAASFARALRRGWSAPALLDALERLAARPLSGQERAMLRAWAGAAGRMAIRHVTVLEVADPEIISRLAATRRGRALIVRGLSPRAVVVDPARLDPLARRLEQQEGLPPELPAAHPASGAPRAAGPAPVPNTAGAAHLWLALRVYQGLGEFLRLPARTPQALLEHLAALAGSHGDRALAAAEAAAEALLDALKEALAGRVPFPPWPDEGLPVAESRALIQMALAGGQAVEMDYYSAGRDVLTHRVVEPWRLEQRGGVDYLAGFCRRAQAERLFRLDRIRHLEILAPDEPEKGVEVD